MTAAGRPLRSWSVDEGTFTVSDLTTAVQLALDVCFPDEVWVHGEISSLNRSTAGHVYFQLVEPGAPGAPPVAQVAITLFAGAKASVNATLKRVGGVRMSDGVEIRLRGRLGVYGPQGRLQVRMTAIDPEFTLGRLAGERDRILLALQTEGLLARNASIPLPARPRHIGLITSTGSAAEADFLHELSTSGLAWQVDTIDVRVQGADAERAVTGALRQFGSSGVEVIALVRGGGARTDLATFDSELVARTIASLPIPVLTGIGHEIDTSVADRVAHTASKTPTACAAHLVAVARAFHDGVDQRWSEVTVCAGRRLDHEARRLASGGTATARAASNAAVAADLRIAEAGRRLNRSASRSHDHAVARLDAVEAHVGALDPQRALRRGWSITRSATGALVRSTADLQPGAELVTSLADGTARSRVTSVEPTSDATTSGARP
jgi:exodeoxyribonuclease VII large subunit